MPYSELFNRCLKVVLINEGGYSNNPADPGGSTNKGITQSVYDNYRIKKELPIQSVKLITDDEVHDIYYSLYWKPMNLESISDDGLVLQAYDFGVNAGIRMSIKVLQRILKTNDDGFIGPNTLKLINEFDGDLLAVFIEKRKAFYTILAKNKPALSIFLKGWIRRVNMTKFKSINNDIIK